MTEPAPTAFERLYPREAAFLAFHFAAGFRLRWHFDQLGIAYECDTLGIWRRMP